MELRLFTLPTCPLCPAVKVAAIEVAKKLEIAFREVNMAGKEGLSESVSCQVMCAPTIMVDDEIVVRGQFISKEKLEEEVKTRLQKWKTRVEAEWPSSFTCSERETELSLSQSENGI